MTTDVVCPKCAAKGTVVVKQSKKDGGGDLKYYECTKCKSLWTNAFEIEKLPVGS